MKDEIKLTPEQEITIEAVQKCFNAVMDIFQALEALEDKLRHGKEINLESLPMFRLVVENALNSPQEVQDA